MKKLAVAILAGLAGLSLIGIMALVVSLVAHAFQALGLGGH